MSFPWCALDPSGQPPRPGGSSHTPALLFLGAGGSRRRQRWRVFVSVLLWRTEGAGTDQGTWEQWKVALGIRLPLGVLGGTCRSCLSGRALYAQSVRGLRARGGLGQQRDCWGVAVCKGNFLPFVGYLYANPVRHCTRNHSDIPKRCFLLRTAPPPHPSSPCCSPLAFEQKPKPPAWKCRRCGFLEVTTLGPHPLPSAAGESPPTK